MRLPRSPRVQARATPEAGSVDCRARRDSRDSLKTLRPSKSCSASPSTRSAGASGPGQITMVQAVQHAIEAGEHLAVQAGTGTGKSLAYLVPSIRHAIDLGHAPWSSPPPPSRCSASSSTATCPGSPRRWRPQLPHEPDVRDPQGPPQLPVPLQGDRRLARGRRAGPALRPARGQRDRAGWSSASRSGPRRPRPATATSWCPASASRPGGSSRSAPRECLGASRCPSGTECFAELARARAGEVDVVVTNHALLAIDAMEDFAVLPEHEVVVVDEAHELVDRVTSVVTGELSETIGRAWPCAGSAGSSSSRSPTGSRRRARTSRRCWPPPRPAASTSCPRCSG